MPDRVLVELDRDHAIQLLGALMSAISEDCYCAGWLVGTEDDLPRLCRETVRTGQPQHRGAWAVSVQQATVVVSLADALGHWVDLNKSGEGREFVPYTPESEAAPST